MPLVPSVGRICTLDPVLLACHCFMMWSFLNSALQTIYIVGERGGLMPTTGILSPHLDSHCIRWLVRIDVRLTTLCSWVSHGRGAGIDSFGMARKTHANLPTKEVEWVRVKVKVTDAEQYRPINGRRGGCPVGSYDNLAAPSRPTDVIWSRTEFTGQPTQQTRRLTCHKGY